MSSTSHIRRHIRNTKRYAEVISVLAKHGFEQLVIETGVDRLIGKGQAWFGKGLPRPGHKVPEEPLPVEVRLRRVLEDLGPTFIKLGQILATRPDLIPPEMAIEFRKLQGDCPTVDYEVIQGQLKEEFGPKLKELFSDIDPIPLAAASMAQVHCATLTTGEKVVLKVLRPGIHDILRADMDVLTEIARFTEKHFSNMGYSPTEVVREFSRELKREVNFEHEGQATERLRDYFVEDENISFPKVYWEATTENVLTLEHIQGVLLSKLDLESTPKEEIREIVKNGADAVFRMCLEFGFFHADPHPANIIALPGGKVCFIDCGMTGRVDKRTTMQLAELVQNVIKGNLDGTIRVAIALTDADPALRYNRPFRTDAWDFIANFEHASVEDLDMPLLLDQFFDLLRRHKVRCPGDLVFLIKALTTIQGVGLELDPEFNVVGYIRPHVENLVRQRYGWPAAKERLMRAGRSYVDILEDLPEDLRLIITQFRRREFAFTLEHKGIDRLNDNIEHASRNIAMAMICTGLIVASSIIVLAASGRTHPLVFSGLGVGGFLIAAFMIAVFLFNMLFRRPPKA